MDSFVTEYTPGLPLELQAKVVNLCQRIAFADENTDDQNMYVPARGSFNPTSDHSFKLEKVFRQKFLSGDKTVLLLQGESGTGKSLFGLNFSQKLASEYKPGDRIPIFISLPTFRDVARNNLLQTVFSRYGFTEEEVRILKETQQFLFFFDAYDELHTLENYYVTNKINKPNEWKAKVFFSCRTSYLTPHDNYKMYFVPYEAEKARPDKLLEIHMAPFNPQQIQMYVKQYLKVKQAELQDEVVRHADLHKKWLSPEPYHEAIDQIPDLKQLIKNPFLLRIAMEVLPVVLAKHSQDHDQGQRTQMTSRALYSAFIDRWFRRQEEKLISESKHPGGSLLKDYQAFSQRLARKMHEKQLTHVTYVEESDLFDDEPTENEWSMFFSDRMIKIDQNNPSRQMRRILCRKGCPLIRVGTDQYAFMHPSIINFLVAEANTKELMKSMPIAEAPLIVTPSAPLMGVDKTIRADSGRRYEIVKTLSPQESAKVLEEEGVVATPDPITGKVVLGQGAFGKFRIAKCLTNGRYCGVKNIKGAFAIKASKNEADLQAQLSTLSNLMPIWDFVSFPETDTKGPVYFQFMPLAGFGNGVKLKYNLNHFQYADDSFKAKLIVYIARELLTGFRNMHMLSIYHLDFKPDNFVIDNLGNIYIIDFGCAKRAESLKQQDIEYMINEMGDMAYFSPERMANYLALKAKNKNVTPFDPAKVDIWALGLSLIELVLDLPSKSSLENIPERLAQFGGLGNILPDITMLICGLLEVAPERRFNVDQALALPVFQRKDLFLSPKEKKLAFTDLYDHSKHRPEPAADTVSDTYTSADSYGGPLYGSASPNYDRPIELSLVYSDPSVLTHPEDDSEVPKSKPGQASTSSMGTMSHTSTVKYQEMPGFWSKDRTDTGTNLVASSKKIVSDDSSSSSDELSKSL